MLTFGHEECYLVLHSETNNKCGSSTYHSLLSLQRKRKLQLSSNSVLSNLQKQTKKRKKKYKNDVSSDGNSIHLNPKEIYLLPGRGEDNTKAKIFQNILNMVIRKWKYLANFMN